jgi:3-methylfumaryl-CoA hydratase
LVRSFRDEGRTDPLATEGLGTRPALDGWTRTIDEAQDVVDADRVQKLALALGVEPFVQEQPLRPLWHWLFFAPGTARTETGEDGHPRRGGFLPPLPHRRRMYAGGRLEFHAPVLIGADLTRRGEIVDITEKTGRSGDIVLVSVRYEITCDGRPAITEEQDLVYTDAPPRPVAPGAGAPLPLTRWGDTVVTDEVLLFRFSALTYNSHRIHYDRRYASETEGYPDLVVHGPLTAILLADLVQRNNPRPVKAFRFSSRAPLYVGEPIHLRADGDGERIAASAHRPEGTVSMTAEMRLA